MCEADLKNHTYITHTIPTLSLSRICDNVCQFCAKFHYSRYTFCRRHKKREAAAEAIYRPQPRSQAEAAAPGAAAAERPAPPPAYEEVCLEIAEEARDNHFLALNHVHTAPFPPTGPPSVLRRIAGYFILAAQVAAELATERDGLIIMMLDSD